MADNDVGRMRRVYELMERVFSDKRFPEPVSGACDLRMFTVTAVWVVGGEACPESIRWRRVCELLHLTGHGFWETVRQDVPRYEPPGWPRPSGRCQAPGVALGGICGNPASTGGRVTNPVTGEWRMMSFCARHRGHARRVAGEERARVQAGVPVPLPNAGGLLPCYLVADWREKYATAMPGWEPPAAGICADDWGERSGAAGPDVPAPFTVYRNDDPGPVGPWPVPTLRVVRARR